VNECFEKVGVESIVDQRVQTSLRDGLDIWKKD